MKKLLIFACLQLAALCFAKAEVFQIDTIKYSGDDYKFINIVIIGDGYTSAEQDKLNMDAATISDYIFSIEPWSHYRDYFNVFAIKVNSHESGAKHPGTASDCADYGVPVSDPNNYLNSSFDNYDIHRLIIANDAAKVGEVLADNAPNYDLALVLVNSPYYGGSGGGYITMSAHSSSGEIAAHELGHSFAGLADEYYAGDGYFNELPNMTQVSDLDAIKWKNWVGYQGVSAFNYCCGGDCSLWYKPVDGTCKMEALGNSYCPVCIEQIVENIHKRMDPIVDYSPKDQLVDSKENSLIFKINKIIKPNPNTLKITWQLDGENINSDLDSIAIDQSSLSEGEHQLILKVIDTTQYVRIASHVINHTNTVAWNILKNNSGISSSSFGRKIDYSVYPNPANNKTKVNLKLDNRSDIEISLLSIDGKTIKLIASEQNSLGCEKECDLSGAAIGAYFIEFKINGFKYLEKFEKN